MCRTFFSRFVNHPQTRQTAHHHAVQRELPGQYLGAKRRRLHSSAGHHSLRFPPGWDSAGRHRHHRSVHWQVKAAGEQPLSARSHRCFFVLFLTCYDDICIDLQLNRKSASQDLPTRLTGKIVAVLERSGLTHGAFWQKKENKSFFSCHNCDCVSSENLYGGWMTYLALLTGYITHTFVSYLLFSHYLLLPVWDVFLVVTWRKMGKGRAGFFNIQTRQRDPVGAWRCRLSASWPQTFRGITQYVRRVVPLKEGCLSDWGVLNWCCRPLSAITRSTSGSSPCTPVSRRRGRRSLMSVWPLSRRYQSQCTSMVSLLIRRAFSDMFGLVQQLVSARLQMVSLRCRFRCRRHL